MHSKLWAAAVASGAWLRDPRRPPAEPQGSAESVALRGQRYARRCVAGEAYFHGRLLVDLDPGKDGRDHLYAAQLLDGGTLASRSFTNCTFANISFKEVTVDNCKFLNRTFVSCYFRRTLLMLECRANSEQKLPFSADGSQAKRHMRHVRLMPP